MKDLNTLPVEVQNEVKDILKAYNEVNVTFEYGEYHVSPCISLKATYGEDHEFIGTYKAKEVYTEKERTINYVESFHDYPIWYKGKRDYRWLHNLTETDMVAFDNNNNLVTA